MIATLADLPGLLETQFSRPILMRRCQETGFLDWSTTKVVETVRALAAGIEAAQIAPGDRVAIMSESRPEWVFSDLAILCAGAITVPVYPTLSASQACFILQDCGARLLIVSDAVQASKVQEVRHLLPALGLVIVIDAQAAGAASPMPAGASVATLADVEARGRDWLASDPAVRARLEARAAAVAPDDLATIIYTSGTTGEPKGVMLAHRNIVSNVDACLTVAR